MSESTLSNRFTPLMSNLFDPLASMARWVAGLLGDHPSTYSRSPTLWNAAFEALHHDARYVPFDIPGDRLEAFIAALRASDQMLGVNVTVPYKQSVIPLLDELDPIATAIGATNTIIRTPDGRLIGSNTDAEGALACLVRERPQAPPFFPELEGRAVLLVGAGGAGRAVAKALLPALGDHGRLLLANRTRVTAEVVARAVEPAGQVIQVVAEGDLVDTAPSMDLVINASTRGQGGLFHADGSVTCLEPYSPLGPANPVALRASAYASDSALWRAWYIASLPDLRENERAASAVMERMSPSAHFFDLVYAPAETTFLRHARWAGHPTLNGADMILHQAVAAFLLIADRAQDSHPADLRARVEGAMRAAG